MSALSTPLLVEFLSAVSRATDHDDVCRVAAERAAHSLQAEVAAVVLDGRVVASLGFPRGRVPEAEIAAAANGERIWIEVTGAGSCLVSRAAFANGGQGWLLVARSGNDSFTVEEAHLVRGMARVVELTLGMMRTLFAERALHERSQRQAAENAGLVASLQERQRLLEQLSQIQRAISRREPLAQILDAITAGAQELLHDEVVIVDLVSSESRDRTFVAASVGVPEGLARRLWRDRSQPMGAPEAGGGECSAVRLHAALAAPVHENGVIVGSLTVASQRADRTYSRAEHDMLRAFADQVSMAVTDAMTLHQMERAFHDSLTGLAGRKLFTDCVEHALAPRAENGVALMFIDLDRFKQVNDSLGHPAGDQLLTAVAGRLDEHLRPGDVASRFGGDEFAVLLLNVDSPRPAQAIADRILTALAEPFDVFGHEVFVNASVGIALGKPGQHDAETLIRNADLAMYEAKRRGLGRHALFRDAMTSSLMHRVGLESDLRRALDHDELVVHFQPIIAISAGDMVGVEALVRWRHPHRGLIAPREFIPLAEDTGLIIAMGRWILQEACRNDAQWNASRPDHPPISLNVNVSARQLEDPAFLNDVVAALSNGRLEADLLTLEISETLSLRDLDLARMTLSQLRAVGVHIALAHFGTGYCSLASVCNLPIDCLKIDRSFVTDAPTNPIAAAIVRAIVELCHALQLKVVAEGVEEDSQVDFLRAIGCERAQGFYFSAAVTSEQIGVLLAAQSNRGSRLAGGVSGV